MKILMVSSYLPYPLFSGGHIRLFNLLKGLSKDHEITLICEKRNYQSDLDIQRIEKIVKTVIVVDRKKQWTIRNILKSIFSTEPFLLVGHSNQDMKKAIKNALLSEKFDLIHVETFYVMQNLPKTDIPVVLVEHNVEYEVYKKFAQNANLLLKPFLYIDILKLKLREKSFWNKATKLVAVSESDAKTMGRHAEIVPNGVDIEKYSRVVKRKSKNKVLFIGDFKWIQNIDSVNWILNKVWPKFLSEFKGKPRPLFWIVGRTVPASLKNKKSDSVFFDENAPSEAEFIYADSNVLLAPIRVGGGTSFKILEAMATGLPVITTPLGNLGIKARANKEILIAENSQEFVNKLKEMLSDQKKYDSISRKSSEFIKKNYDWSSIVVRLEKVYKEAI